MVRVSVKSIGGSRILRNISGDRSGREILGTDAANNPAKIKAMVDGKLICLAMRVMTTTRRRIL
jgi:phosphosulfolactate phosphohydrolase-like enzyme